MDDLDLPQTIVIAMDEDEEKALEVATRMTTMYLGQQPHIARASGVDQDLLDRVREAMGGWPPREGGIASGDAPGARSTWSGPSPPPGPRSMPGTGGRLFDPTQHLPGSPTDHRELRGDHRGVRSPPRRRCPVEWRADRIPGLLNPPGRELRYFGNAAVCALLAATMFGCTGDDADRAGAERVTELEEKARSLEESLQTLAGQNAELKAEIALLRERTDFVERQEAAEAAGEHDEELADFEEGQEEQPAILAEGRIQATERLDDLDIRVRELEEIASKVEAILPSVEQWSKGKNDVSPPGATALERTVRLAEESGGEVHYIDHPEREEASVLILPMATVEGQTPLIVSLHGYGGDSAHQSLYVPLHERVNTEGFALLLPNGTRDGEGNRSWNPTDECCDSAKAGGDDVAFLTELVARAEVVVDFGPVYFFGYSNGGFMSYHMACKGLPGLRAVASLAGTSYVEDILCDGAPPVSVLHIHGTEDEVIRFDGDATGPDPEGDGETAFYAGAREMVTRWSRRAGCDWPEQPRPYATLDLDRHISGSETQAFRVETGCSEGIAIELWMSVGSSHAPAYGDAFLDALLDWLLSQQ